MDPRKNIRRKRRIRTGILRRAQQHNAKYGRFLSNIWPNEKEYIGHDRVSHARWVAENVIGPPHRSHVYTEKELARKGMKGLYMLPDKEDTYNFAGQREEKERMSFACGKDAQRMGSMGPLEKAVRQHALDVQQHVFYTMKRWQVNVLKASFMKGWAHQAKLAAMEEFPG